MKRRMGERRFEDSFRRMEREEEERLERGS